MSATQVQAARKTPRPPSRPMSILVFVVLGCLQTIVAYLVFQRSDDHGYFLDIANHGLKAVSELGNDTYDLKAQAAGLVFYIVTAPSRWLGGGELTHMLWLRLLTLGGFVCAHRWVCRVVAPGQGRQLARQSQTAFLVLCLLYPAQLAWTASLLRDGVSCAGLFAALLAFSRRNWLTAAICTALTIALRPEFLLVLAILAVAIPLSRTIGAVRNRLLLLGLVVVGVSVATFVPRAASSDFAIFAFGDEGVAFPSISSVVDIHGYLLVLLQSMLDPISIGSLSGGIFPLAEVAFFTWLTVAALRRLNGATPAIAALLMADLTAIWIFGYFEVFVSGFSRHRLGLVIILIALIAVLRSQQAARRRQLKSPPPRADAPRAIPFPSPPGRT